MTRTMENVERQFADADLLALVQPPVRRKVAYAGHAETAAAGLDIVEQIFVRLVRPLDRHSQRVAQFGGPADVIDMTMGEPDLLDVDAGLLDRGQDLRNVAAGVDHDRLPRDLAPQQRAI